MKKKHKILIWIGAFLLILCLTNPSNTAFKYYVSLDLNWGMGYFGSDTEVAYGRKRNYFIFSIYEVKLRQESHTYIGFVQNFRKID